MPRLPPCRGRDQDPAAKRPRLLSCARVVQSPSAKVGRARESLNKCILCLCLLAPGHENATPWAGTLKERGVERGDVKPLQAPPPC